MKEQIIQLEKDANEMKDEIRFLLKQVIDLKNQIKEQKEFALTSQKDNNQIDLRAQGTTAKRLDFTHGV